MKAFVQDYFWLVTFVVIVIGIVVPPIIFKVGSRRRGEWNPDLNVRIHDASAPLSHELGDGNNAHSPIILTPKPNHPDHSNNPFR
jgi:hypothetical protein